MNDALAGLKAEVGRLSNAMTSPATSVQVVALLSALGCRLIYEPLSLWMDHPAPLPEASEPLVRNALRTALHAYLGSHSSKYDKLVLMDGFLQKERWRDLLATSTDSYAFAELILATCGGPLDTRQLRAAIEDAMFGVFSEWLGIDFDTYPSASELAGAMFGMAWVELVMPAYVINPSFPEQFQVACAMRGARPTFLPGLVTWQDTIAIDLPMISCFESLA